MKIEKSEGTFCQATLGKAEKLAEPEPLELFETVSFRFPFPLVLLRCCPFLVLFFRSPVFLSLVSVLFSQWLPLPLRSPGLSPPSPMRRPIRSVSLPPRRNTLRPRRSWYGSLHFFLALHDIVLVVMHCIDCIAFFDGQFPVPPRRSLLGSTVFSIHD